MTHTKLLMRRLAYVPWLLVVGLVLGWSGEAVANSDTDHATGLPTDHTHVTDPYLDVDYSLDTRTEGASFGEVDSVFVSWSTSYSKNFAANTGDRRNGTAATTYQVGLFKGEVPANPANPNPADTDDDSDAALTASSSGHSDGAAFTFTGTAVDGTGVAVRRDTLLLNLEDATTAGKDFYWARIKVEVQDADESGGVQTAYFVKQRALKPTYKLSVSPISVREDAKVTDIMVTVEADAAVEANTPVPLQLATNQTDTDRFTISSYPTLTIPRGKKEATGTIRFTPIRDKTGPDDDILVTIRTRTSNDDGSADIRLVDVDKESYFVNLEFTPSRLNKRDPATDIVVTATLDGKPLDESVRIPLTIDKAYEANPTAAERDRHYNARMATVLIRRGATAGRATINIRPMNLDEIKKIRSLRVIASANPKIGTAPNDRTITVNGELINITGDPSEKITGLTAAPFSIREDAGSKEVTLEVVLQNALATDERVQFNFDDGLTTALEDQLGGDFEEADIAERDRHYHVTVDPLIHPEGRNQRDDDDDRHRLQRQRPK